MLNIDYLIGKIKKYFILHIETSIFTDFKLLEFTDIQIFL